MASESMSPNSSMRFASWCPTRLLRGGGGELRRYEWECLNAPAPMKASLRRIMRSLSHLAVEKDELTYCLESTATYHYPLMRSWGGRPCVVNPAMAASFKARKTDRIDAFKLAQQHLQGLWPQSFVPSAETEAIRAVTRSRKRLRAMAAKCYNSISTRLWQWSCQLLDGQKSNSKKVQAQIEDFGRGIFITDEPQWDMAKHVPPVVWQLLTQIYATADRIKASTKWCEEAIPALVDCDLAKRLVSVPGIGPITAAIWMAEIEPASRFPGSNYCVAYCGLDPTPQISGGKKVGTKLRFGNSNIRPALIQASQVMLNTKSKLAAYVLSKKLPRKLAVVVGARKLAAIMYTLSTKGGYYDETKVPEPIIEPEPAEPGT